jgi:ATP-dependent exoDNAse (exonuclease V) beta subunit
MEFEAIAMPPKLTEFDSREQTRDRHLGEGTALYLPLIPTNTRSIDKLVDVNDDLREYSSLNQQPVAKIIGKLAHKAIQRWLFPDDQNFDRLLEITALNFGLVDENQRENALRTTRKLLARLQKHKIWVEIDSATVKHHEVPYTMEADQLIDSGKVDLIYQTDLGWKLVDFKLTQINDIDQLNVEIKKHHHQMARYRSAMQKLLTDDIHAQLCFLDCMGQVKIINQ